MGVKLENPGNCAQYVECRATVSHPQLGRHQAECPYPQLYSSITSRCENFDQVQCGKRFEPRAPCKYNACSTAFISFPLTLFRHISIYLVLSCWFECCIFAGVCGGGKGVVSKFTNV